uniref:Uncharacterized protein n=1 Tax=Noctiluca scintillans TaxID=2966 RepID=A0A7S1B218_NOCSC
MPGAPAELLRRPDNRACADCGRDVAWASVNLGVFVCSTCASVHRTLGAQLSKIKSVKLDEWRPEWVRVCSAIGNANAQAYYEHNVPPGVKYKVIDDPAETEKLEAWINMKYVERRFAPGSVEPWQALKRNMAEQAQAAGSLASQSPHLEGRSRRKPDAGTSPPSLSRASLPAEPSFPPMRDSGDLMQWASDVSPGLSNASPQAQSSSPQASSTPAPPASGAVEPASSPWVVKRSECDQYRAIFQQVTSNEFVEPTVVRAVLMPSGLPVEELSLVWRMSDMDADGKLSLAEFLCAMTLVARRRQGIALPTSPPKELLTSLLVETGTRADTQFRTTSSSTVPTPAFTPRESLPVSTAAVSTVAPDAAPTIRWKPSAEELVRYRALFGSLDTAKSGYVSQAQAQPLMSSSGLPAHDLAHIWKISDVDQDSRLTVSEFLCVLAISAKRRCGASLPETLPAELQELVGPPPQQKPVIEHDTHAQWTVSSAELDMYRTIFTNIDSAGVGAIRRAEVQAVLETSQLSQLDLDRVWDLIGATDLRLREFACALALTARRRQGLALPKEVPPELARQVQQLTAA